MLFDTPFVTLPINDRGRDFCVGDLHGCREMLDKLMRAVDFDPAIDRLFSVGDLVHRGPDSGSCLLLAEEPWFFAVLGNHEAMQISAYAGDYWIEDAKLQTGLEYLADADPKAIQREHQRYQEILARLPLAIEVALADGRRVGITHAALRWPYSWADVRSLFRRNSDLSHPGATLQPLLLWDRLAADAAFAAIACEGSAWIQRLSPRDRFRHHYGSIQIGDIDLLISGHTQSPLHVPLRSGKRLFLDTGAGWPDGWLSMVELNTGRCWQIPDPEQSSEPARCLNTIPEAPIHFPWLSEAELAGLSREAERVWLH